MSDDTGFVIGQVVCRKDSWEYAQVRDIKLMEEDVPTFCDGNFFDTKGPFIKVSNTKTWAYHGQFRALTHAEAGIASAPPPATGTLEEANAIDGARK